MGGNIKSENLAKFIVKRQKKTCSLTFRRDKEIIRTWDKEIQGDLLCLTSALLKESRTAMLPWISEGNGFPGVDDINAALERFYQQVAGDQDVLDIPVPAKEVTGGEPFPKGKEQLYTEQLFSFEILTLKVLIERLLTPKQDVAKNASQQEMLAFLGHTHDVPLLGGFMAYRLRQLSFFPESVMKYGEDGEAGRKARRKPGNKTQAIPRPLKDRFNITYESNGLMALCWAEVWHCIDHQIKANVCPYCWEVYLYPKNNLRKAHCGAPDCKNKYVQESNKTKYGPGWENERKRNRDSGRKQGSSTLKK